MDFLAPLLLCLYFAVLCKSLTQGGGWLEVKADQTGLRPLSTHGLKRTRKGKQLLKN